MIRLLFGSILLILTCSAGDNSRQSKATPQPKGKPASTVISTTLENRFRTGNKYLTIENIEQIETNILSFNISWDASWRAGEAFDAAWVFIKKTTNNQGWEHATIQAGSPELMTNNSPNQVPAQIAVSPEGMGIMIYRAEDGQGDNNWRISLRIKGDLPETKYRIFGLEMIHVASGAYDLGTLKNEKERAEELTPGASGAPYNPFYTFQSNVKNNYGGIYRVSSEATINIGKTDGNLYWLDANIPGANTFSGKPQGVLEDSFPKGFQGFFQMKYELSQQEYCDFLNTLTPDQQRTRDITQVREFDRPISDYRNAIVRNKSIFTTNRPQRPCNFISWLDGQAYADWAGIRHMTELEFEKSCRGTENAIYREYVWGVNEIIKQNNMVFSSSIFMNGALAKEETGQEYTNGNVHASMFSYANFIDVCTPAGNFYDPKCDGCRSFSGGDGGRGPVRRGIFATTANGDRVKAGATYYGAMEMGGNLQEPVVTVGHPSGRKFAGSHGNGQLAADGNCDNPDWQPINNEYAFGGRGGCWKFHENHARTSDRFKGLRTNQNRRASHIGFRGVRTNWEE